MTMPEKPPEPVIDEYDTVLSRPCLRAVAYLSSHDSARERLGAFVALLQGPLRALVTVCSGTHLRPKERRHRIGPKDFDALGAVLEPRAHYAGFMLFGDAMLDAAPFALPMFRLAREPDGFTVELAFRPDVDVDWVTGAVWPVLRDLAPDYAYLGWGVLPYIAGHEHGRRVTARHKARYRAAACLDATMMTKIILDEEAARRHAADADEPTEVGIADLGWKTILGPRFASRIDLDALAATGAVLSRQLDGGVEITVEERPVWGDVNAGADAGSAMRRQVLMVLRPIRASKAMMLRWAGLDDMFEAADILETYFAAWPSADLGEE